MAGWGEGRERQEGRKEGWKGRIGKKQKKEKRGM